MEFAKEERERVVPLLQAATDGARLRFRPVMMTSFAFILGLYPLVVAVFLANETRSLIAGEAAHPVVLGKIRAVLDGDELVIGVRALDTLHLGPQCILVAVDVDFVAGLDGEGLLAAVADLERRIGDADPRITPVVVSPCTGAAAP